MVRRVRTTLLEHFASQRWFGGHGEVALTTGLGFCLNKDPGASEAVVQWLNARAQTTIRTPSQWHPEYHLDDATRPDLVGFDDAGETGAPSVVLEAKLSATFDRGQLAGYAKWQHGQLASAGAPEGILAILVPDWRKREAVTQAVKDLLLTESPIEGGVLVPQWPRLKVVVVSWQEFIEAAVAGAQEAADDLSQLLAACGALEGVDAPALDQNDIHPDVHCITEPEVVEASLEPLPGRLPRVRRQCKRRGRFTRHPVHQSVQVRTLAPTSSVQPGELGDTVVAHRPTCVRGQ